MNQYSDTVSAHGENYTHLSNNLLSPVESATNEKEETQNQFKSEVRAHSSNLTKNTSLLNQDENDELDMPSLAGVSEDTSCMGSISSRASSEMYRVDDFDQNSRDTNATQGLETSSDQLQLTPQTPIKPYTCDSMFCLADLFSFFDNQVKTPSRRQSSSSCIPPIPEEYQLDISSIDDDESLKENDEQIQDFRKDIESNILSMIGCTSISGESWERVMDHLLCKLCTKALNDSVTPSTQDFEIPKLRNRNSYNRDKAMKRIQQLRNSGLGKQFSLVHISDMLKDDLKQTNPHRIMPSRSFDLTVESEIKRRLSLPRREDNPSYLNRFIFKHTIEAIPSGDSEDDEVELFYDSDPGGHLFNRERYANESINLPASPCKEGLPKNSRAVSCPVKSNASPMKILPSFDINSFPMNDMTMVLDLVNEMIFNQVHCVFHPSVSSKQKHPLMVKAWFEMGSCVKTTLIQPSFVWRSLSSGLSNRRDVISSLQKPQGVELLEIVRIVNARPDIDRLNHSFMNVKHSFVIITNTGEEYLFELASEEDRDKFVFGFKVLIARLASKIIVGDRDVFEEFFAPQSKKMKYQRERPVSHLS